MTDFFCKMVSLGHYVANCWLDTLPLRTDKIPPTDKAQLSISQDRQSYLLSEPKRHNQVSEFTVGHSNPLRIGQNNHLSYSRVGQNNHLSYSRVGQTNHEEMCLEYFPQQTFDYGAATLPETRPRENSWDVWFCRNCFCLPFKIDISGSRCRSFKFFKSKRRQVYIGDVRSAFLCTIKIGFILNSLFLFWLEQLCCLLMFVFIEL